MRILVFAFALASYAFSILVVGWAILFTGDLGFARTVDSGAPTRGWIESAAIDIGLIALFGIQHTIMARAPFKAWLARWLPPAAERSTFVLASSAVLALLFAAWQPIAIAIWNFNAGWPRTAFFALFWAGWAMVFASTWLVDHFDLFGLRQAWLYLRGREYTPVPFKDRWLYRRVRHPLMASFLVAFWAAPTMTIGHALFAAGMTAYILVGIRFEERDLLRSHGSTYADYLSRVPMLLPGRRSR